MRLLGGLRPTVWACVFASACAFASGACGSSSKGGGGGTDAGGSSGGGMDTGGSSGSGTSGAAGSGGDATGGSNGSGMDTGGAGSGGTSNTGGTGGDTAGGSNGVGGDFVVGDPLALEDYPAAMGAVLCPDFVDCCTQLGIPLDETQCSSTFATLASDDADADPDNYDYDADDAGTCLETVANLFDGSTCEFPGDVDPLCGTAFNGTIAPGEPCSAGVECAREPGETVSCSTLRGTPGTVCVVNRAGSEGDPCYWSCTLGGNSFSCSGSAAGPDRPPIQGRCYTNEQLYCSVDAICEEQGDADDPCLGQVSCKRGTCSDTTNLCSALGGENDSCSGTGDCEDGLYCNADSCVPELEPGSSCESTDRCRDGSCEDGTCVEDPPFDSRMSFLCSVLAGMIP